MGLLYKIKQLFPGLKYPVRYIIRKGALGDVLWLEPMLGKLLKRTNRIVVITAYPELFDNYPSHKVSFQKHKPLFLPFLQFLQSIIRSNFFVIDLTNSYESNQKTHILSGYYLKAGLNYEIETPNLYLNDVELNSSIISNQKYVVLHIANYDMNFKFKNIYGINWAKIVTHLKQLNYNVVQIGGKDVIPINGASYLSTTIREMISIIKKASFFIGSDSGPSHIASSLQIPSIIFFGAINPKYIHRIDIFKGLFIKMPCEYANCYHEKWNQAKKVCIITKENEIPKCCIYNDSILIESINKLLKTYNIN